MSDKPPIPNQRSTRWIRAWVSQELAGTGRTCEILKWVREDKLKVLNKKTMESESEEPKPEPTTEILFLCSYESCSKAFSTEIAYRKHSYTHGDKQHACTFPGCKKKFRDSSKLKRHQVVHTGERNFFCPYEGCGKAFSLDFNMRSHVRAIHEKTSAVDTTKQMSREAKICKTVKTTAANRSHASSDRRHACPYEGCGKAYIYKYKLEHHMKNQHPDLNPEDSNRRRHVIGNTTCNWQYDGRGPRSGCLYCKRWRCQELQKKQAQSATPNASCETLISERLGFSSCKCHCCHAAEPKPRRLRGG